MRSLVVYRVVTDCLSDLTKQLQNAIVGFAFRERFDDLSGLFKAIGGVCHIAKMVHPPAIGNEPCGDRQASWRALQDQASSLEAHHPRSSA